MSRVHTLLIQGQGARFLDGASEALVPCDPAALRDVLPRRARVQLVLADAAVHCAEVPFLARRERRDVARRLAREAGFPAGAAHCVDRDPHAEGGHVLWLASCPRRELDPWLEALREAGATVLFAVPWQRALAAAGLDGGASTLFLLVERGEARLVFFRGLGLRFARTFRLPDLDQGREDALFELSRLAADELTLLLHFLQQKHRHAPPAALSIVGLPAQALPALEALDLECAVLSPDLGGFLARGADRERQRGGGLDLVPAEVREARRTAALRAVVRGAVAGTLLLGAGARVFLERHERTLTREAQDAETAAAKRQALARDGEEAARQRLGLLRLRRAEERQAREAGELERLGLRFLRAAEGVDLRKVEIAQDPAHDLVHRFTVEGNARTGRLFSLGFLAAYVRRVEAEPGLKLEPLKEVAVEDGQGQAQTNFRLEGTAP